MEIQHLAVGNYAANHLIFFCTVMLQLDHMMMKASDIRRVQEHRMFMWKDVGFVHLVQEAIRCDKVLWNTHKHNHDECHTETILHQTDDARQGMCSCEVAD